jgi:glutathione synthase/RimK-type ligase-like ATP-grasp enzyme
MDASSLKATLASLAETPWYPSQGALVQELVPPRGYDLRILVAGGQIVGAVHRFAAEGEWRTNISLGGVRQAVSDLPIGACTLALAAARASGASLVGVDLLPGQRGGWIVLELNGAVEFTHEYAVSGDVFAEVRREVERAAAGALATEARDPSAASMREVTSSDWGRRAGLARRMP